MNDIMGDMLLLEIFSFILGAIVGSFLNVCIFRIPREKSIVRPGSSCPGCSSPIRFYDNIPLMSYLVLRGKCRKCGEPISIRYPAVELLTALFFAGIAWRFGLSVDAAAALVFACILVVISFIDLEFQIIPDIFSLGGLVLGLLLSFLRTTPFFGQELLVPFGSLPAILQSLLGVLLGGGILYAIARLYEVVRKAEGMGGGDIKLLAMIGAFCGITGVVFSLVAGSIVGALVGLPLMLIKGQGTKYAVPFGPFLSLGALLYVFAGDTLINAINALFSLPYRS
ncbi:MAG: prepilin peptidase [Syntrophorhabdales bacterium]